MTKKTTPKTKPANLPVTKQTAGAVTGAVVGSMIAGPAGAIIGGVAGAVMGNRVTEGKSAVPPKAVETVKTLTARVQKAATGKPAKTLIKSVTGKAKGQKKASTGRAALPADPKRKPKKSSGKKR